MQANETDNKHSEKDLGTFSHINTNVTLLHSLKFSVIMLKTRFDRKKDVQKYVSNSILCIIA